MKKSDNTFNEATKEWLLIRSRVYSLVIEGVSTADDKALSFEGMTNLVSEIIKVYTARAWWIEHRGEELPKEECQRRIDEGKEHPLRVLELQRGYKPYHYHLVLWLPNSQTRLGEIFRFICDRLGWSFDVDGHPNSAIHIEKSKTPPIGIVRYLIHKDNPEKKEYSPFDVITNDRDFFDFALKFENGFIDFDGLMEIIRMVDGNKLRVIKLVGLDFYNQYRATINDIIKEVTLHGYSLLY